MNAADSTTSILIHLAGAVALLIWAVRLVRTGATRAFGSSLRQALARFTQNRASAMAGGAVVTLILQSSTATTLLLSSFVGQTLIALPMAFAVLLGANIGTALAAFIVSLDLGWIWGLCLAVGVALYLANEAMDKARNIGRLLVGIGLILLSLVELKAASAPLAQSPTFRMVFEALAGEPVMAIAVAVLATWLTHSSLAIVLLIASFWSGGLLSPAMALTLIVGANLGNALVPVVDQLGAPVAQRRVAVANLFTRMVITLAVVPFAKPLAAWIMTLSSDSARLAVEIHLGLNILGGLVFLPFVTPIATLVTRLMPAEPATERTTRPLYLDPGVLDSPSEALACAMRETLHLGDRVGEMLKDTLTLLDGDKLKLSREIAEADDGVDAIHEAIKLYLVRLSRLELSEEESKRLVEIITLNTNLEHIGDIIDKNLRELAEKKIRKGYPLLAGRARRDQRPARQGDAQPAPGAQRARHPRHRAGAPALRREAGHALGRAAGDREPLRAAAQRGPGVDRDLLDPSRRAARPQAHPRPHHLDRLSDPGGGRRAEGNAAAARGDAVARGQFRPRDAATEGVNP
ncbi:Na/Pi cotransporter family protein [Bosea caraganae]|uniref:Na/Pi cotransporter family protein n=1 Tax=Bosea caraganae TaxID=2763117 RepID=A0A370L3U6_9HYPH|nr:Na/Pi cotransporter family protein [Bosea caraganae]RDJ23071.1 Na/Pi cotransporter family protein [Bosea caraganae]RDJ28851.1 Na/Pi cotransporter family protein [Bosea caraganae]